LYYLFIETELYQGEGTLYAALEIFFWNVFVNRAMDERMFFQSPCNERKCFHGLQTAPWWCSIPGGKREKMQRALLMLTASKH
jgi:hypothetical protein